MEAHTTRVIDIIDVADDGTLTVSGPMIKLQRGKLGLHGQWDWDQIVKHIKRMATMDREASILKDYEWGDWVRSQDHRWFGATALDEKSKESDQEQQELECLLTRKLTREDISAEKLRADEFKQSYLVLFVQRTDAGQTYKRIGMGQVFLCEDIEEPAKVLLRSI